MLPRCRWDLPGNTAFSIEAVGIMEKVHRCDSTSSAVLDAAVMRCAAASRVPAGGATVSACWVLDGQLLLQLGIFTSFEGTDFVMVPVRHSDQCGVG